MTLSSGRRGALAAAAGAVAALALAAPAAHAADTCPNAAVRAQQSSSYLTECRAYELVSPVDKEGQMMRRMDLVSPDGNVAAFSTNGAMAGALGIVTGDFAARRTDAGWVTTPFAPPLTGGLRIAALPDAVTVEAFNETFDEALVATTYPYDPDDQGRTSTGYLTDDIFRWRPGGPMSWLTRPLVAPDRVGRDTTFVWASSDLDRVLVRSRRVISPDVASPTGEHLYLYADGRPADLVSETESGTPFSVVGTPMVTGVDVTATPDGDTIALRDTANLNRLWVRTDATDPQAARTTSPAWGPERRTCEQASIVGLTDDGRELLTYCDPLRTEDTVGSYYRGNPRTGEILEVLPGRVVGASADLRSVLSVDDSGANKRVWFVDANGTRQIAETGTSDYASFRQVAFTPDGGTVIFSVDQGLGFPTGGFSQVFRYRVGGQIECISCYAGGRAATGASTIHPETMSESANVPRRGAISRDGRRVFFTTANALVARDVNNKPDAYMWQDGELHLLGPGDDVAGTVFSHASEDGSTAFVYSAENLAVQDVDNGIVDAYAVRIDGGFLAPEPAAPCTAGCQGPLPQLEALQTPGTVVFAGPGDVDDAAEPAVVKVFSVAGIGTSTRAAWARGGRAAVQVRLSHAGTASAVMRARIGKRSVVVARVSRRASAGGTVALPLRLSRRARSALRRQGALRTTVRVSVPGAGGAQSASFVLRVAKKKGGR